MRPANRFVYLTVVFSVLAIPAMAQTEIPTIQIPDEYSVGNAPDSVTTESELSAASRSALVEGASAFEGANALNGTLYAVIAPTFDGSNVTSSFFRFVNGGSATSTFSVTVVGSPSGDTYGTAMIDVPTRASPQFSLAAVRDLAGASDLVNGDTSFALYIQNADQGSGYQCPASAPMEHIRVIA